MHYELLSENAASSAASMISSRVIGLGWAVISERSISESIAFSRATTLLLSSEGGVTALLSVASISATGALSASYGCDSPPVMIKSGSVFSGSGATVAGSSSILVRSVFAAKTLSRNAESLWRRFSVSLQANC